MKFRRLLSTCLASAMLLSTAILPAAAQDGSPKYVGGADYKLIAAEGEQKELGYVEGTAILEVDGLKFKDMNGNGKLDGYEDWRLDTEGRITDLLSQMTLEDKLALMIHCNTAGAYTGTYPATEQYLWEQDCPFEVPDLGQWNTASGYSCWWYINKYGITHFLDNTNGTAEEQIAVHNAIQQMCEETRLGVPMTFSCDRFYNGWGGWTDDPHDAFGAAADKELSVNIWSAYMKEMRAIGYQLLLHPYSNELGSYYGEDPAYVAEMAKLEIETIRANGVQTCAKHWIARGGDASFAKARSVAQTVDNWMEPWKAVIEAGTDFIMCSTISGLGNNAGVVWDKESMDYLRDTLGYDGIVLTDWTEIAAWGKSATGITADGTDLSTLSLEELYGRMFSNGVDQIGNVSVMPGNDYNVYFMSSAYPDAMKGAVEQGYLSEETVEAAARRLLRPKFNYGLFENPYSDPQAAMELVASEEYLANPWDITTPDELAAARNPELVAAERQLQAESTILVKNDNDLLPLSKGTKVYFESTNQTNQTQYAKALAEVLTLTDSLEEADVALLDITVNNDTAQQMVEDAKDAGKPVAAVVNAIDPVAWELEQCDAVLATTYKCTPDHGAAIDGFSFLVEAPVYAALIVGDAQPNGMVVKEIARDAVQEGSQWKDLAGDMGASDEVRLMLLAMMKENPTHSTPNNLGDPLLCYEYGMHYGQKADFEYDTLVLPHEAVESVNSYGRVSYTDTVSAVKAGESFRISFLLWNHGDDGIENVQVKDGDTVLAEKLVAVNDGSWRVVSFDITIPSTGVHTLTVGSLSAEIVAE